MLFNNKILTAITCVAMLTVAGTVFADEGKKERFDEKYYEDYYPKARYDKADRDGSGELSYIEWDEELRDKEQNDGRWDARKADRDGNGTISLEEARFMRQEMYNDTAEALLREYARRHNGPKADKIKDFIKEHPRAARTLFANNGWLRYPEVADELIKHKGYLEEHPEVGKALNRHKEDLAGHQKFSKKAYRHRKWSNRHKKVSKAAYRDREYLKNHKKVSKELHKDKDFYNKHHGLSKRAYRNRDTLNRHPNATKRAHKAAHNRSNARNKAMNNPQRSKKAAKRRRSRR